MAGGVIKYTLALDSKGFEDGLARAGTLMKAVFAGAIVTAMKGFLDAQAESEDAINQLNLALANQGKFTEATSKSLQGLASELQRTTRFSDEAVLKAGALLASFGMNEAQIKRTTAAAADYGAATGKDLTAASEMLAKAFAGKTTALEKLGFHFTEGATKAQKFEEALRQVEQRFGGSAATQAASFSGQMVILKNTFGDVQESLGKLLGEMAGSGKPFDLLIKAGETLAHFFGVTLILALSEARAQLVGFFAAAVEIFAKTQRFLAPFLTGLVGIGGGVRNTGDVAAAGRLDEFAKALRAQIPALREQGDLAAMSAGNILKVTNATGLATRTTDELTAAQKKLNEELAKSIATSAMNLARIEAQYNLQRYLSGAVLPGLPPERPRTVAGRTDTPGAAMTWIQAQQAWLDKYGAKNAEWAAKIGQKTKEWKFELTGVVQLATQIAGMFADISGKAASIGAALGAMMGASAGQALGGPAGAQAGAALGGLFGGLIGSLFGKGAREAAALAKQQKDLMSQFESLAKQIDQLVRQMAEKAGAGIGAIFDYMASRTDLTADRLQRFGIIGMAVFESLRKSGMSVVDALRAMGPQLAQLMGHSSEELKKLQDQYDELTRTIELKRKHGSPTADLELQRWQIGKEIEKGQGATGPLVDLSQFAALVQANETLVRAAEGLGDALSGIRATGNLTAGTFAAIQAEAGAMFADLIDKGFTSDQALAILAPTLLRIRDAAADMGLAVDADTQKLIDAAEAGGFFKDLQDPMKVLIDLQKLMIDILIAIAKVFKADLPESVQKYLDKLAKIPENITTDVTIIETTIHKIEEETQLASGALNRFFPARPGGHWLNVGEGGLGEYVTVTHSPMDLRIPKRVPAGVTHAWEGWGEFDPTPIDTGGFIGGDDFGSGSQIAAAVAAITQQQSDAVEEFAAAAADIREAVAELAARPQKQTTVNATFAPGVTIRDESLVRTAEGTEAFDRTVRRTVIAALRSNADEFVTELKQTLGV